MTPDADKKLNRLFAGKIPVRVGNNYIVYRHRDNRYNVVLQQPTTVLSDVSGAEVRKFFGCKTEAELQTDRLGNMNFEREEQLRQYFPQGTTYCNFKFFFPDGSELSVRHVAGVLYRIGVQPQEEDHV